MSTVVHTVNGLQNVCGLQTVMGPTRRKGSRQFPLGQLQTRQGGGTREGEDDEDDQGKGKGGIIIQRFVCKIVNQYS